MPGFDGTGPNGRGPATGRGLGYCTGYFGDTEPYPARGRPRRGGPARGRGFRGSSVRNPRGEVRPRFSRRYLADEPPAAQSTETLESKVDRLEQKISELKDEIRKLGD